MTGPVKEALKPCPFCGGEGHLIIGDDALEDSPAGILDVQRMLTIHQPTGWLARDIAIASARLQPQVSASGGEDAELCKRLEAQAEICDMAQFQSFQHKIWIKFADVFRAAAARIRSLSAQLAEARNMLDIEKQAAQQHILERLNQRDRATASQSEIDALRERIGVLEKALEPFAKVDPFHVPTGVWHHHDESSVRILSLDDFCRARTALEGRS